MHQQIASFKYIGVACSCDVTEIVRCEILLADRLVVKNLIQNSVPVFRIFSDNAVCLDNPQSPLVPPVDLYTTPCAAN